MPHADTLHGLTVNDVVLVVPPAAFLQTAAFRHHNNQVIMTLGLHIGQNSLLHVPAFVLGLVIV